MQTLASILADVRQDAPVTAMRDALADMGTDLDSLLDVSDGIAFIGCETADEFDFAYAGEDFIPFGINDHVPWQ
jgi:hypothetical protein